jgi:hypothetical protein
METGTPFFVILVWLGLFILAVPVVRRIRHPDQRLFAAHLIFVMIFTVAAAVLFALFSWLAVVLGFSQTLERVFPAVAFLLLVFGPAFVLAVWQARKPRWRKSPPP